MRSLIAFFRKLGWLAHRSEREAELREELRFHIEEEADQLRDAGLTEHSHVLGQHIRFAQLLERETTCLDIRCSAIQEFLVPQVEMLRELLDDVCLSARTEVQRRQTLSEVVGPIRHGRHR